MIRHTLFLALTLMAKQANADCFKQPYYSVQGGRDVKLTNAVIDVDDYGDIAVAGFATNLKDASKSAGFINLREGVSCLTAWQRTFASSSFEFRAVKIEPQTLNQPFQWLKVHAAAYEKNTSLEIFMSFDASGKVLFQKAIQSAQKFSQYLVSGIQILQSQKYLLVSDTRIQKLDEVGNYFYQVNVIPTAKRIRYASIQGQSVLLASTLADSVGVVTGINVQSIAFVDTDLGRWEQGLSIQHGYGSLEVEVKAGVYPGAQIVTEAAIFVCSHASGSNVIIDDPLTVKNESATDSIGNSVLNPGVYFDLLVLRTGIVLTYSSKQWVSCHDVRPVTDKSAYFLLQGPKRDKLYLVQIDMNNSILEPKSVSYMHPNLMQSVSFYESNIGFIQTSSSKYVYGFSNKIAKTVLDYQVLVVTDLSQTINSFDLTPYTQFNIYQPTSSKIIGGQVSSKNYRNLVSVQYVLTNQQPQDYWTTADIWEPYLATISKGKSNYEKLGAFTQRQDQVSLQSILRFQKNAWIKEVCPAGMIGSNFPQNVECWLSDSDSFSTCQAQKIDLEVLNDQSLQACFPRRIDHSTLNYDYTTGQQYEENLKKGINSLQYPSIITLNNSGRRSQLSELLFSDTQQEGVAVSSYGDASFLAMIQVPPGSGANYWILDKISAKSAQLSSFEVAKIYCARYDWNFNFLTSDNLCSTFDSFQQRQFQSPTILSYDTFTQYVKSDKIQSTRSENFGQYHVHIELASLTNRLSLVYSFDTWLAIGNSPYGQSFLPSSTVSENLTEMPVYRTHANPYSPININYEWPVYYELNKFNSSYIMTPPENPIDLSTFNITLPGYLPGEFYVDTRVYIVDPLQPIPPWTEDNIGFDNKRPWQWTQKQVQHAYEDEYKRYKENIMDSGTIVFSSQIELIGDPDDGNFQLVLMFSKNVAFPSYLDPNQSLKDKDRRLLRDTRKLAYQFSDIQLSDSRTELQTYMQTRPNQLVDPAFRKILQASQINEYLTRVDTFSQNPDPLPADQIYANKVAAKVKSMLIDETIDTVQSTISLAKTQAYNREAEIALLAEMERQQADQEMLMCIPGYLYDSKQNLCLKDSNVPPKVITKELPPPKLLPIYFGEITNMISVSAMSQGGNKTDYQMDWKLSDLDERSVTINLNFKNPREIKLSDYVEVSLDFSSFDKNWKVYSTITGQKESGPVKTVQVSLRNFDPGTGKFFKALREIARVLQMVILAYFTLCAALKVFANVSAFNGFILLNSIQLLIHIPLLGLEFPKLTGYIMKPLIVIAKCDLGQIVKKKLAPGFRPDAIAQEFSSLQSSFDYNVAAYFDALYGSALSIYSIHVILILFAISVAALILIPLFYLFQNIKVADYIYKRLLLRTFFLNFPLRLTLQTWLFVLIGSLLNFWLQSRIDQSQTTSAWSQVSMVCSILLMIVIAVNQVVWLTFGCLPTQKLNVLMAKKRLYQLFGALIDGLQIKRAALLYVGLSLLRKSLFVFSIFILKSGFGVAVWFQVIFNTWMAMAFVIFLILTKPHEDAFSLCLEIYGELTFITTVYAGFNLANGNGFYTDEEVFQFASGGFSSFKRAEIAGYVILSGMLLSITIQTLLNAGLIFSKAYLTLKVFIKRGQFKTEHVKILETEKAPVKESFAQTDLQNEESSNQSKSKTSRNLLSNGQEVAPSSEEESDMSDQKNIITGLGKRNVAALKTGLPVISESDEVSIQSVKKPKSYQSYFRSESDDFERGSDEEYQTVFKARPQSAFVKTGQKNPQTDTYEIKSNKSASNRLTMDRPKRVEFSDQLENSAHPKSKQSIGATSSLKRKHLFYQNPDQRSEFSKSRSDFGKSREEEDSAHEFQTGPLIRIASKERPQSAKQGVKKIKTVVDAMVESSCLSDHFEQILERRELSSKSIHKEAYFMTEESKSSAESEQRDKQEVFETNTEIRTKLFKLNDRNASSSNLVGLQNDRKASDSQLIGLISDKKAVSSQNVNHPSQYVKMTDKSAGRQNIQQTESPKVGDSERSAKNCKPQKMADKSVTATSHKPTQTEQVTQAPQVSESEESESRQSQQNEESESWTKEDKSEQSEQQDESPIDKAIQEQKAIKVIQKATQAPESYLMNSSSQSLKFEENSSEDEGPKQGREWTDSSQSEDQVFDFWKRLDD